MAAHNQSLLRQPHRTALLALGDFAMFVVFAALGVRSHNGPVSIGYILETAAPFALSWGVIAPFVGAYRSELLRQPQKLLARTMLAWALALVPGIALRALLRQSAFPPISFAITTFIVLAVLLSGWRLLFAWLMGRGKQHDN